MELHACGLNAHSQITSRNHGSGNIKDKANDDVKSLTKIAEGETIRVMCVTWSSTVFLVDGTLELRGHSIDDPILKWKSQFLDPAIPDPSSQWVVSVASLSTGRTSIVLDSCSSGKDIVDVLDFCNFSLLEAWWSDAASKDRKESVDRLRNEDVSTQSEPNSSHYVQYAISGRPEDLRAGATCFILLTKTGDVYTWGDPRHSRCLARQPSSEYPAERPGIVEALGGIPIGKIDASGWIFGALSKDKDLYIWGSPLESLQRRRPRPGLKIFFEGTGQEYQLVEIPGVDDFLDFGVGSGHIVAIAEGGDVWVIGDNTNGQLGLGERTASFVTEWTRLEGVEAMCVTCGDFSTFLTTKKH